MLKVNGVSARYDLLAGNYLNAVDNVEFTVPKATIFGIAGESGCGKSTLLKVLYDQISYPLELSKGDVEIVMEDGTGQSYKSGEIRKNWWKIISYVPQGAMHVMNPVARIRGQFLDAVSKHHQNLDKKQLDAKIIKYLEDLELPKEVLDAYPHQLSGGMRQRVIIAMSMFLNPDIVLADEPTTALDVVVQRGILMMLRRVQQSVGNSIVIVSHDMGVHYQITDRIGIMYAGQMIEHGLTEEIFERPRHPYTQMLINSLPRLGDNSQKEGIPGAPPSLKNPPPGCRFAPRCTCKIAQCAAQEPPNVSVGEGHFAKCHLVAGGASI